MATYTTNGTVRAVKARIASTVSHGDPLSADGECLRLQGLVAAYHRNLKQAKPTHQRVVLQKALRRAQAELRLARRQSRRQEVA